MDFVYVVGSHLHASGKYFIADRVYLNLEEAIIYCNNRKNSKYVWTVQKAPTDGTDYNQWENVHRSFDYEGYKRKK